MKKLIFGVLALIILIGVGLGVYVNDKLNGIREDIFASVLNYSRVLDSTSFEQAILFFEDSGYTLGVEEEGYASLYKEVDNIGIFVVSIGEFPEGILVAFDLSDNDYLNLNKNSSLTDDSNNNFYEEYLRFDIFYLDDDNYDLSYELINSRVGRINYNYSFQTDSFIAIEGTEFSLIDDYDVIYKTNAVESMNEFVDIFADEIKSVFEIDIRKDKK